MNKNLRGCLLLLPAVFMAAYASAESPNEYRTVGPAELRTSPQRYWARPILYIDTLSRLPGGPEIRFEGRKYVSFSTTILGNSFAVSELVPLMKTLDINKKYVFTGSVIQYHSGFLFFKKSRYYVIVSGVNPPVDTEALTRETGEFAAGLSSSQINLARQPVEDILWTAYSSAVTYARENNIELWQVYDPKSEHFPRAVDFARAAVKEVEEKQKTTADELLALYAFYYLARENTKPEEPKKAEVTTSPVKEKKAEAAVPEESKPAPVEEIKAETNEAPSVAEATFMTVPGKEESKESPAVAVEAPAPESETNQLTPVLTSTPVSNAVPRKLTAGERKALAKAKRTALEAEKKKLKAQKEKAGPRSPDVVVQKKAANADKNALPVKPASESAQKNVIPAEPVKATTPAVPAVKPTSESMQKNLTPAGPVKATTPAAPAVKPTPVSVQTNKVSTAPVKAATSATPPAAPAKAPPKQPTVKP